LRILFLVFSENFVFVSGVGTCEVMLVDERKKKLGLFVCVRLRVMIVDESAGAFFLCFFFLQAMCQAR